MIGLIFATLLEARPFLAVCGAEQTASRPFAIYETRLQPGMRVIISGMGKVAAAAACQALILTQRADAIVNAGVCGALQDDASFRVGQMLRIVNAMEGDHEIFGKRLPAVACGTLLKIDLAPARLVTCDRPVFDSRRRAVYGQLADVVDMEGAAIARVADLYALPCELIKGVSDSAGPLERKTLLQNLNTVCEQMAQMLWRVLVEI